MADYSLSEITNSGRFIQVSLWVRDSFPNYFVL